MANIFGKVELKTLEKVTEKPMNTIIGFPETSTKKKGRPLGSLNKKTLLQNVTVKSAIDQFPSLDELSRIDNLKVITESFYNSTMKELLEGSNVDQATLVKIKIISGSLLAHWKSWLDKSYWQSCQESKEETVAMKEREAKSKVSEITRNIHLLEGLQEDIVVMLDSNQY